MLTNYFSHITFAQPWFFCLFGILPILLYSYISKNKNSSIIISSTAIKNIDSLKTKFTFLPFLCRLLALSAIILALAKPQTSNVLQQTDGEGIDIVLCLDVSGSMTAQDFLPNRLEAAKQVAKDFIVKRNTDKIGVVIFAGESFTQCPVTTDYSILLNAVDNIHNGLLADGTSIGDGLGTSVDRLKSSKQKSKVVILLTDGENNGGLIDPKTAKEIAKAFAIKVYTIGVGTTGYAPQPVNTPLGVQMQQAKVTIDEKLLTEIAKETGGKYFRANNNNTLIEVYKEIDALEKSKVTITNTLKYTDKFELFVFVAILCLLLEQILKFTWLKKFP